MALYTINENILNQCVNESINEFMIEEGWGDWAKDAVRAFMHWRTNGKWNNKWNQHIGKRDGDNYNNRVGRVNRLNTWFKYHKGQLQSILSDNANPEGSAYQEYRGKKNSDEVSFTHWKYRGQTGAQSYLQTYCNYKNFVEWSGIVNKGIQEYITTKITKAPTVQDAMNNMDWKVYSWWALKNGTDEEGDDPRKQTQNQQNNDQNQNNQQSTYGQDTTGHVYYS